MIRSGALSLITLVLFMGAAQTLATPPPENRPQYCASSFCVEVIAYSSVEGAVIDRGNNAERISIRLQDGTRIAFAARPVRKNQNADGGASDWAWDSPSMATSRRCMGCDDPEVPSLIVGVAVAGDPELVTKHLHGSLCGWSARYRWRGDEAQPRRIELGERECFRHLRW